jgi:hypothetical protein
MERLRSIKINVEIDTSKATYAERFELGEEETRAELDERVKHWIESIMELLG